MARIFQIPKNGKRICGVFNDIRHQQTASLRLYMNKKRRANKQA